MEGRRTRTFAGASRGLRSVMESIDETIEAEISTTLRTLIDDSDGAPNSASPSIVGNITAWHKRASDADYFQFLGVPRDASADEVGNAYRQARRAFAPESIADEVEGMYHDELRLIREVIEEAGRVLVDPNLRLDYRAALERIDGVHPEHPDRFHDANGPRRD
jgi:hypothetical protein